MDIYFVETHFHLLISMVKALISKNKSTLVITVYGESMKSLLDDKLINRIKKEKIFSDIIVNNYLPYKLNPESKSAINILKRYFFIKKKCRNCMIDFSKFENVYVFNDVTVTGKIINNLNVEYVLLEDGTDCFKNNSKIIECGKLKGILLKKFYGVYQMGTSKLIKYIEVNDKTDLKIGDNSICEFPKKKLFKQLSKSNINKILKIYEIDDVFKKLEGEYSLLITQPLYCDKLISSSNQQIKMYNQIINEYLDNEKIIIKTHPRESINYDEINNSVVIKEKFPIELINYIPNLKLNKIITISSTSINVIDNCKEKIFLGWDWLDRYKKSNN